MFPYKNNGEHSPAGLPRHPRRDVTYTALHCSLMENVDWDAYMYVPHLFIPSSPNLCGNHGYLGGGLGASLEPDNYRLLAIPQ